MKAPLIRLLAAAAVAGLLIVVPRLSAQEIGAEPIGAGPGVVSAGGGEVLTRGPVHEAFAAVVNYEPRAGLVVDRQPPEPIEEVPPDERPVGADVAWIPGYWGWDDDRNDFIWVSGTWRVLPPGRAWISGYWGDTGRGWQWTSGYWADAAQSEVTYLPPPPETLERGPSIPRPADNFEWAPGSWEWRDRGYAWRPGYWIEAQQDWVWTPSYYVWTPRGYVYVSGYWDYAPQDRGLLFAPVYYRDYGRRRYEYTPSVVLNLAILADFLFLRPDYCHYYFGDYYDARYENRGFFAEFSFQSSRRGYDPFYSYERWQHRDDRNWEQQRRDAFDYRRRHEDARPPRTWSGSTMVVNVNDYRSGGSRDGGGRRVTYAESVQQYARSNNTPVRIERTAANDRQRDVQVAREMQRQRTQRREIEAQPAQRTAEIGGAPAPYSRQASGSRSGQAETRREPSRVERPQSPIVARSQASGRPPPPKQPAPQRREEAERDSRSRPGSAPLANQPPQERQRAVGQEQPSREGVIGQDESARRKAIQQQEQSRQQAAVQSEQARQRATPQSEIGREQASRQQQLARDQAARQQEQDRQRAIGQADQKRAVQSQEIGREPSRQQELARDQAAQKQRDAADAQARAQEQQKQSERLREERPGQDRQALAQQQRDQAKQQAQARQEQARNEQQRASDQAREQESKVAAQAREQQRRAGENARAQQELAAAQQKRQQEQAAQQEKEQQSRVAEQARQRQQQAAEQAAQREQEKQSRVAEQARQQQQQAQEQKARAAELAQQEQEKARKQAESVRPQQQNLAPTGRVPAPPPQKKAPPPKKNDQSDDDNRKKKDQDGG